jgi:hypothetical protein
MRITVFVATALVGAWLGFAADAVTSTQPAAKKKATGKAASTSHSTGSHSTGHTTARKTVAKRGKKGPVHSTAAVSRQANPTPERYQEIQQALASKGYLPAEQANGQWSDGSLAALKRFQADQNLEATGKINSLSLIALGLGPKHETTKPVGAAPATPQQP